MREKVELLKNAYKNSIELNEKKLINLREKLNQAKIDEDEYDIEKLLFSINEVLFNIYSLKGKYHNLRVSIPDDTVERKKILKEYSKLIDEVIPDDVPLVFHGNNNIGLVEQIMKSGGLFTPEERGVGFRSFASQIDVAYKKDIHVPLEYADPMQDFILPYGAIFVFFPKENEIEKVLKTYGSEVAGGVQSINFKTETDRLFAIITTKENIQRLKKIACEVGIDENIIVTHEEFLKMCKEKYQENIK